MFDEKDIILLNKLFSNGVVSNKGSLSFALSSIKNKGSPNQFPYLIRAITTDHVFEDGNKRTAAVLITAYFTEFEIGFDKEKVTKMILEVASKNIINLSKIRRMIQSVIR